MILPEEVKIELVRLLKFTRETKGDSWCRGRFYGVRETINCLGIGLLNELVKMSEEIKE